MAWKNNESVEVQQNAVMSAIRRALNGKRQVTATEAYEAYKQETLPEPITHFSNRRFLDYIHKLEEQKQVKCIVVSRGRKGAALHVSLPEATA
jgi:Cdc6-like AAA superfamily ATPase